MVSWIYLLISVVAEASGTAALVASKGFTRPLPTALMICSYVGALFFLSLTIRTIPVGVAYAVWCGIGIVLISLIAWIFFGQKLDSPAILGITFIVIGVVILNAFSKATLHH
ncbi:DMT family transporter [Puniceicoccus vermicola]|uniref:Multidrug efflux SMR transporter n=1 Tax=Puniceicoccus vermicola TaxID=388746 RepID=A0A7X1E668_9BACT|nr:multidrug efflux SMR transporter [Puniceicoccus vermicola]MBC2603798.1 multidrug efflux SMR transporter [Puniceicoccus vermicola]